MPDYDTPDTDAPREEVLYVEDDDDFERLVDEYFAGIYSDLNEMGVPEDRMPATLQVLSHIMDCIDESRLRAWMQAYAAAEGKIEPPQP